MSNQTHVIVDPRWEGNTGIGRLYKEVLNKMPLNTSCSFIKSDLKVGNPLSPLMLGIQANESGADVFYSPSFMPPARCKVPFIFTVHDLMHLYYYSGFHRFYYKKIIANLALNAKKIITVSQYSKTQLVDLLGIPASLIKVIYNGVDRSFFESGESQYSERPYLLYVGNRRKNKNIPAMLTAFAQANIPKDFIFALSGEEDVELGLLIDKLQINDRVKFLGFIPEKDLPKLYREAHATMFVSLMEGFGLPVIESMASGTPVLTSSISSLPEIAGDAALCVDPTAVSAISSGIEKLVHDGDFYLQCVSNGIVRAQQFSWEKTAHQTWDTILS
ncbi:glycosyltransferase family 4 protein [Algoriphagus litoralis]|uniref:glycosyltransferase family 4 protein n=1 Tax=Algoriphagus litoralis TaxID=2202829 RepID=UPI000DBA17CE|nr:glycosyltransferase family 1 protein [Algoriphagus litoralis]